MKPRRTKRFTGWGLCVLAVLVNPFGPLPAVRAVEPSLAPFGADVHQVRSRRGVVVSASQSASVIGRDVLANGGNAVDASVAVAFALAVAWPEAGNIGGGGFMMVAPSEGDVRCIEYRETAPALAQRNTFKLGETALQHKAAGVPGTVAGLFLAHQTFGQLKWSLLVQPAVDLARKGVPVDKPLASSLNGALNSRAIRGDERFDELRRVYGKADGTEWKPGDKLHLPDLAETLQRIADHGRDGFYKGPVARLVAKEMKLHDGLIREGDLEAYQAKDRAPIRGRFKGYDLYGAPPPSSGGTCSVLAMQILDSFELKQHGRRYSARTLHLMGEAMRRAFHQRALHLGDPDFVAIPTDLVQKEFALQLASEIDSAKAGNSIRLATPLAIVEESPQTTHFSVVDSGGMAVSNTYTLEASWGCKIVVPGAGFVLNNEMGDFNWTPGRTDTRGRIGTEANTIQPKKRMLSSQCPTIVRRDGKTVLVTGSPGGRTIINTVVSILVSCLEYGMPLDEAIRGPRLHHQWLPDRLSFEGEADPEFAASVETLRSMGHQVDRKYPQGSAQSIAIEPDGTIWGVADWRRSGYAAGVE
jgi:gamma-glutamyltranspeptidase/glutathione hydrolase